MKHCRYCGTYGTINCLRKCDGYHKMLYIFSLKRYLFDKIGKFIDNLLIK